MTSIETDTTAPTTPPGTRQVIRGHPDLLELFPAPPETIHGLPAGRENEYLKLKRLGVIERVGTCEREHPDCSQEDRSQCLVRVWRFTRVGYRVAQEEIAGRTTLPCGHPPFSNPRERDGYSCTEDGCDARYSREEILEVTG